MVRGRIVRVLVWVTSGAVLSWGCSDAAGTGQSPAAGGTGGSSAGAAHAGGSAVPGGASTQGASTSHGGAAPGGMSETEACLAYVQGYCEFYARCKGDGDVVGCYNASFGNCPDVIFSPGSTRTVQGTLECGAAYATWSCERYAAGELPACTTPGTHLAGEPCAFSSQCASLSCSSSRACGTCREVAAPGGACSDTIDCPGGQFCGGVTCVPDPEMLLDGKLGDACSDEHGCSSEWWCNETSKKCEARPGMSEKCGFDSGCQPGLICHYDVLQCLPLPQPNEPCFEQVGDLYCADGAYCSGTTCKAFPIGGEPCAMEVFLTGCAAGFSCRDEPPTCVARGSRPDCSSWLDCAEGDLCDNMLCKPMADFHEVCDAGQVCRRLSTCTNGKCEPDAPQGLFETRCAP